MEKTYRGGSRMTKMSACSTLLLVVGMLPSGRAGEVSKAQSGVNARQGVLQVESSPPGARVLLDGRPIGRTPLVLEKVKAGPHEVKLQFPDFAEATRRVEVRVGRKARVKITLRPLFGGLRVTVPEGIGARVLLDGDDVGPAPVFLQRVLAGPHQVRVIAENLPPYEKQVTIRPGRQEVLKAPLERNLARLLVSTTPVRGQIYIDGKLRGSAPLRLLLPPGKHELQARAGPGSKPVKRRLSLRAGRTTRLRLRLPVVYGSLRVSSKPAGAAIEIDGRRRGRAPVSIARLSTGVHVIVARSRGREPLLGRVEVLPGRTARVEMDLDRPERSRFYSGAEATVAVAAEKAGDLPALVAPQPAAAPQGAVEAPAATAATQPSGISQPPTLGARKTPPAAKTLVARKEDSGTAPAAEPAPTVVAAAERPMSTWRLLAWVSTGTAGAAVVTMAVLFGVGAKTRSDADDAWARAIDTSLPRREREEAYRQAQDLDSQADNLFLGGWITTGLAVAAGGAALYLFLAEPGEREGDTETALHLAPLPGGGWVGLKLAF